MFKKRFRDKNHNGVDDRLDYITNFCSIALPFTTLDQLYIIYVQKQVVGISSVTWFLYGVLTIPLFIYALRRKDLPMIILNGLWLIIDFLVWFGIILYS